MGPKDEIRPAGSRLKLKKKPKNTAARTCSGSDEGTWDSGLRNTTPTWERNINEETEQDLLRLYSPSADENAKKKENLSPNVRLIANKRKSPRVRGLQSFLSDGGILAELNSEEINYNLSAFKSPEEDPMGNREDSTGSGKRKRREEDGGSRKKSSTGSVSNDIIEVGDSDEEESPPLPSTSRRTTRSSAQLSDQFKLCEFPPGAQDSVSVCVADYKSLEHDTFLNDIIIDFYLTYLLHKVLPPEERTLVHMFSTMFYKRLTSSHKSKAKEEQGLSSAQKKHSRVKTWTKNVNIFEKQFVIIPICEHSHWYLVIIIKPGQIVFDAESRQKGDGEPLFLVLDSLGGGKSGAVENIRHYLEEEWQAKNPGLPEVSFSKKEMKTVRPKKPEQENFSDCGIFLLHYVEKIFMNLSQFMFQTTIEESTEQWLNDTSEFSRKRKQIADIIEDLSREKLTQSSQLLPSLNFYVPLTRSKARKPVQRDQSTDEEDFAATNDDDFSVAASGFYGERSGLRSGKSRTNLILENASLENRERQRDRESRSRKAKTKDLVEAKTEFSHSVTSDYKIPKKPNYTPNLIPLSSSKVKEDLFEKIRDSKPTVAVRKHARVPEKEWNTMVAETIDSIEKPKVVKARADLHKGLRTTKQGSHNFKASIIPTKRPGLAAFKDKISSQSEKNTKAEEPSSRWDKASPDPSKAKLTETILSHLEKIDKIEEAEVAKDLDQMQIEDEPEPEPPKVRLSLREYRNRQQISIEDKSGEGEKIEEISVVSSTRSEDKDEVTVVSDRDDVSSVVQSVVINGGQKDDEENGDVPTRNEGNGNGEAEENHEADVTTISDNEDAEDDDGTEEIQEELDPDVTTVPDSDEEEHVTENEVTALSGDEQVEDSGKHAPDVTIYSDSGDGADEDPDQDSRPGSVASVSIQSEIIMKPNISLQGDPAHHHRDNSNGASMLTMASRTSTPEIVLEVNETSSSRRPDSPGPEVVQITKSIPEDAELKITLTKSPPKSVNASNTSPPPTIELEEDDKEEEEEIPPTPVFKKSRAPLQPKLKVSRKITSKLKVSESDDSDQISFEEGDYISTSARPKRRKAKFPGLSEIEKAKLKNLPYTEREKAFKSLQKEDEKELSIDLTSDEETKCNLKWVGRKVVVTEGSGVGKCRLSPEKTKRSSRRRE